MHDAEPRPDAAPEPVTTRSLGMFNVIFGILFILAVLFEVAAVLAMPAFGALMAWGQAQQQQQIDARHKAQMDRFEQRLQEAGSDEERATIEAERTLASFDESGSTANLGFSMNFLDDPRFRALTLAKCAVLTGLNAVLIAAGVWLIRFRPRGRTAARLAAALLIPAGIGFAIAAAKAAPKLAERWTADLGAMLVEEGEADEPTAEFDEALENYERGMTRLFAASNASTELLKLIYPVAVLIVASRPGVRAACERVSTPARS